MTTDTVHTFQYDTIEPAVVKIRKNKQTVLYSDNIVTFDIETVNLYTWPDGRVTGFDPAISPEDYRHAVKSGYMIIWQMSVDGHVMTGRTWPEFAVALKLIREAVGARLIVWVHNLSFEFQFLRNIIDDFEVFARAPLRPFRAYSPALDVEFRDTQCLTNSKLEQAPKLLNLSVKKQTGKWDYDRVRTPATQLTDDEMDYAVGDVLVTDEIVKHFKVLYNHLARIPMTNTSCLRKEVFALYAKRYYDRKKIATQCETDPFRYRILRAAFAGGYTHANPDYVGKIVRNMGSYDEASSYPAQIMARRYPWGQFTESRVTDPDDLNPNFAYLLRVRMINVTSRLHNHYISFSRCLKRRGTYNDNGRIVMADLVEMVITDVDLRIIRDAYLIGEIEILEAYCSPYRYLDTDYVKFMLEQYAGKTVLKGVPGQELLYNQKKVKNNSLYGMMVTDVIRDDVVFADNEWKDIVPDTYADVKAKLEKVADPNKCFLSYAWGVWITAWARWSLWQIIKIPDCDKAIVYCDTDSIKFAKDVSKGAVEAAVERYNQNLAAAMYKAAAWHGLDPDSWKPKDIKGRERPLGFFEYEGTYSEFRTWGAKKYAYVEDGTIHQTVAGVAKTYRDESGAPVCKIRSIKEFKPGLTWSYSESGRTTAYYNRDQAPVTVDGYTFHDRFGICVMPTTYTLGVTDEFTDFIAAAQNNREHTGSRWLEGCLRHEQ